MTSALGGRRLDGQAYATHPPLTVVAAGAAEAVLGEHPWVTRLAAWAASLAAIPLLYLLAREVVDDPVAAAGAVVAGLGTPMFFLYGMMLDTPVIGFAFGVAVTLVWYRQVLGREPPTWIPTVLTLLAALTAWQAALLCGLAAGALAWRRRRLVPALPYLVGTAAGLVLSIGWGLWVYGGLGPLLDKLRLRSGGAGSGLDVVVANQARWMSGLLGLGLIGLVASLVALRDRRLRPLVALLLVTVVGYALVFREAAGGHPYWNYWALLPTVVGFAYAFGALDTRLRVRGGASAPVVVTVLAIASAVISLSFPTTQQLSIADGVLPVERFTAVDIPDEQTEIPYLGGIVMPEDWILYETGRGARQVTDPAELADWALVHPDHVALVVGPCPEDDRACSLVWPGLPNTAGDYAVVTGRQLTDRLGAAPR